MFVRKIVDRFLYMGGAVLLAVRWAGSHFVAVGAYGVSLTSPDGFSWTQHDLGEQYSLGDMEWNGDRLVAVGDHWETGGLILSSRDGVNWEECLPPGRHGSRIADVAWVGDRFVAVGFLLGDTILTSNDGLDWSAESTGTGLVPISVGGDERTLYVTGRGGKIIRQIKRLPPPRRPSGRLSLPPGNKDMLKDKAWADILGKESTEEPHQQVD